MTSRFIVLFLLFFSLGTSISYAAISFTLTPIRYELELDLGESITLPASIRNNGTGSVTLTTTSSDFTSSGDGGTPSIVRKSELVYPDQQLSTWITLSSNSITLAPGEEGTIDFTIDIPLTATPGGHYGAVLFKNSGSETGGGNISINVDYGIIILVTVSGEVVVSAEIGDPSIGGGSIIYDKCDGEDTSGSIYDGSCGEPQQNPWYIGVDEDGDTLYQYPDSCPLGDFTTSKYDNKCISNPFDGNDENNDSEPLLFSEDFEIYFSFPIENTGNTHIKPIGKVVLTDEDGNIIKAIGKISIENERGLVIDEKIVDYLPINNESGNVLPSTSRIFQSIWKGFPYKTYDDSGNLIINYWSPSEYYTQKNKNEAGFLMFWERVSEVRQLKTITADIEINYNDENGNPITFNTAQEFPVQYIEEKITFNPYIILSLLLIGTIILMTWIAVRWWSLLIKSRKCWNCKEKIKSHWETCPYCKSIQNKKMHKKLERQSTKGKATSKKTTTIKKKKK